MLPKMFAHYGAGHLTLLYAVPWTPWLLLCQRKYFSQNGRISIPPGLVLALIFLVDVRWGAFALLTWWAYALSHLPGGWWDRVKQLAWQTALTLLIAAPQLLPLIEFSALSTRAELKAADVLEQSLPVPSLLGLLLPNTGTIHEWVLYTGGTVLLLALGGLLLSSLKRNKYFWGILSLVAILVALGSQIPGSTWIANLPLISMLRVPSRALFLAGLGITSLAGFGLDSVSNPPGSKRVRIYALVLFGVSVFTLLLVAGFKYLSGELASGMLWGTLAVIFGAAWIGIGLKKKLPAGSWLAGVFLLVVLDLAVFDLNSFVGKSAQLVLSEGAQAADYIASQGGDVRTYSPSYSLQQQTAVHHDLRMADGVDPLQLAEYADFMEEASGVPRDGYSVTIPPYANGEPGTDNASYLPDAEKLGLLNVGYVASEFVLEAEGLILEKEIDGVYIYRNEKKRFPAWVQPGDSSAADEIQPAEVVKRSANAIKVTAHGPGMLVVPEIAYPGWSVFVDGVEKNLHTRDEILMGVDLAPGTHRVKFVFRPRSVYMGVLLFCAGFGLLVWSVKRNPTRSTGE
jgi:LPXTG-motif cell wall-anchored protein